MKKILFSLTLLGGMLCSYAQTTVWMDDFNDEDISDWTLLDEDGDGNNWGDLFQVTDSDNNPVTPVSLISRSWQGTPLTPDNWAISPAIDLSNVSGPITLKYITQVAAFSWDEEKYSVHVGTSMALADLLASPVSLTEVLGDANNTGAPVEKTLDLSSLAGESTVYIAFRHWDVTDMDYISIDDVEVIEGSLATVEVAAEAKNQIALYPNPAKDLVKVNLGENFNAGKAKVTITSATGKIVSNVAYNANGLDVSRLPAGVYILTVTDGKNTQSKKLIKK